MVSVPPSVIPAYGPGFNDPDFVNLWSSYLLLPDLPHQAASMFFISALKAAGIWSLLDGLFVFAAHDIQGSLINWKSPFSAPATVNNQVQFFPNLGLQCDGVSGYINSNVNPSTLNGNFQQNFAHIGAWSLTSIAPNNGRLIGEANGGTSYALLPNRQADGLMFSRLNEVTGAAGGTPASSAGHFVASRNGSSGSLSHYVNGVAVISGIGNATSALVNDTITFAGAGTSFNEPYLIPIATIGGYLTPTQVAALYTAGQQYLAIARTLT